MKLLSNQIYFKTLLQLNNLLDYSFKKKSIFVFLLIMVNVILELIGISFIAPIILIAFDFKLLMEISIIKSIYETFNFSSIKLFIIIIIAGLFLLFLIKSILSIIISKKFIDYGYQTGIDISSKQFKNFTFQNYLEIINEKSTIIERNIVTIPNFLVNFILLPVILISSEILVIIFILFGILLYDWKVVLLLFFAVFLHLFCLINFLKINWNFTAKDYRNISES